MDESNGHINAETYFSSSSYYNIKFINVEREDDGVNLEPGSYWTFGDPTPSDQLSQDESDVIQPASQTDNLNLEVDRSAAALPSRDISQINSSNRIQTQPDPNDPLSSFNPVWESSQAQTVDPSCPLVPNRVYSLPSLPGGLSDVHKLNKKVLAKAEKLSLHPHLIFTNF